MDSYYPSAVLSTLLEVVDVHVDEIPTLRGALIVQEIYSISERTCMRVEISIATDVRAGYRVPTIVSSV